MTVSWKKKSKNKHVRRALPSLVSAIKGLRKTCRQLHFFSGNGWGGGGGGGRGGGGGGEEREGSTPTLVAQDKLRSGVMG